MKFAPTLAMLAFAAPAFAQQQPPAPVERQFPRAGTLHVESRLVPVAVNVTDEHGSPIGGLTQDDFEVFEDNKAQKIAVFDRESTTPLQIVLAIDTSGSVFIDSHLEHDTAKSFLKPVLRPQDRIDLMAFSDRVDEVVGFTNDAHRIESALGNLPRGDATAMYDAIYLGSQRMMQTPVNGARRVLVLITDGENTTRHGSYDSALEQAERAGAMVYSLIIVPVEADAGRNTGGEHALIQMSNDTGGKYYYVADKHDLAPAFQH
jgi:Ca-activated chloride channel family protein